MNLVWWRNFFLYRLNHHHQYLTIPIYRTTLHIYVKQGLRYAIIIIVTRYRRIDISELIQGPIYHFWFLAVVRFCFCLSCIFGIKIFLSLTDKMRRITYMKNHTELHYLTILVYFKLCLFGRCRRFWRRST